MKSFGNLIGSRTRSGGREPLLSRTSVSYRVAPYSYRIRIVDHISYRFASHPYRIHIVSASYRIVSRAIVSYRVVSYRYRYLYRIVPCRYRIVFVSYPYRLTNHCIASYRIFASPRLTVSTSPRRPASPRSRSPRDWLAICAPS